MIKSIAFLFFIIAFQGSAQNVTGVVTTARDIPIQDVNVEEKGTYNRTTTNSLGHFSFVVNGGILVFSAPGYSTRELSLGKQSSVVVMLEEDPTVAIGYGVVSQSRLTGAVVNLGSQNFNPGVIATPEQLFAGKIAGVTVTPSSGEPGATSSIAIRGYSSPLPGNNEPLYVIDGMPMDNNGTSPTRSGVEGTSTPKNPLFFLNPDDIASIVILKDAAAAIYGMRAANGVILVTTKSGEKGKGGFTFNTYAGFSKPAKRYDLLNSNDFLTGVENASIAAGVSPAIAKQNVSSPPINLGSSTDWQNQIFRTSLVNGYQLGWGMANTTTKLRVSGSYENQPGVVNNSGLTRLTGRVNLSKYLIKDKLSFDAQGTVGNVKNQYAPITDNAGYQGSLIQSAIYFNPTAPVYSPGGTFFDTGDGRRNPAAMLAYLSDNDNVNRIMGNLSLKYEILDGLALTASSGINNSNSLRKSFADPRIPMNWGLGNTVINGFAYNNQITGNGRAVYQYLTNTSSLLGLTLSFDRVFRAHAISANGGYNYQEFKSNSYGNLAWGLNNPVTTPTDVFIKDIDNFNIITSAYPSTTSTTKLTSYFARVGYGFREKIFITGILRDDESSKFASSNRNSLYYGLTGRWKLNKETFAGNNLAKWFTEFDLRGSYGKLGSQEGLDPHATQTYTSFWTPYGFSNPISIFYNGNSRLKPETATAIGVALDWKVSNRIGGTIEYFNNTRDHILNYSSGGGFGSGPNFLSNSAGAVVNRGVEVVLIGTPVKQGDFYWNSSLNMTFYKNEVKNFGVPVATGAVFGPGLTGAYAQIITNGHPLFTWSMPQFTGYDASGVNTYASNAQNKLLGSALPTFSGGLSNEFSYKNLELSFLLTSSTGFYVYNNTTNAFLTKSSLATANNVTYAVLNSIENPRNPNAVSSKYLEKGDFVRLSYTSISYRVPLSNSLLKSLSVSITGQNLLLLTKYSGLDPLVNVNHNLGNASRGFDYGGYPPARTFILGLKMQF